MRKNTRKFCVLFLRVPLLFHGYIIFHCSTFSLKENIRSMRNDMVLLTIFNVGPHQYYPLGNFCGTTRSFPKWVFMSGCLQQDQAIKRRLVALHQPYPSLGLDRLYHLIRKELSCSRKRIHRFMNELHIFSLRKRAYKDAANSNQPHPVASPL